MIDAADVAAVLVTRGDVDLQPIIDSLPFSEVVVWDNAVRENLRMMGRYAAIAETTKPVVFCQDDDCIVKPETIRLLLERYRDGYLVAQCPTEHRVGEPVLVGWGALFRRDLPAKAFARWEAAGHPPDLDGADVVFSALTPQIRINIGCHARPETKGHVDFDYATAASRMYRQPWFPGRYAETQRKAALLQ